jgi:hypothetical protein
VTDIALDLNPLSPTYRDVLIANGDLVLVDKGPAILQHILQRLSTFLGEWFLDNTIGIPYFQQVLVKTPNQATIDAIFINAILNVPGVTQLTKYGFKAEFTSRTLRLSFTAQTTAGIVNYAGLIEPLKG